MTLREALRNKKRSTQEMNHQANAWQVYGEETLVLFYVNWEFNSAHLDKLLDYLSLVDKLVVALPVGTSDDTIFRIANLQVVDGIVLYKDMAECMNDFSSAKFAFEGTDAPSVDAESKARILAI
jgi:hypothetical protein